MAEYPVKGATVKCNKSGQTATFEPIKATGANMGKGLIILETDTSPDNIVGNFGTCSGNENKTCTKSFEGEWQNCSSATYDPYSSLKNQYKTLFLEIQKWHTDKNFAFVYVGFDGNRYSATITPNNISNFTQSPPHIMFGDNAFQLGLKKMKSIVTTKETLPLGFAGDTTGMFPTKEEKEQWLAKIDELYEQSKMLPPMLMSFNNNVVLTNSYLKCKYGIVSFVVGEEGQETEEPPEDLDNLADLRERVREVIRKHYDVGSPSDDERNEYAEQKANEVVRTKGMTNEQYDAAKETARQEALDNFKTADDKLKNTLIATYGVSETTDENGNQTSTAEENAEKLLTSAKIRSLDNQKTQLNNELENTPEDNSVRRYELTTMINDINSKLNTFGTLQQRDAFVSAQNEYLSGLSQTNINNVRMRRIIETKALAEFVIMKFEIDNAEALELMAWLVLLNENDIGDVESSIIGYELNDNNQRIQVDRDITAYSELLAIETISEQVENGDYNDFGVNNDMAALFMPLGAFYIQMNFNKEKAYALPLQFPLYNGNMSFNYGHIDPTYGSFHTGIDLVRAINNGSRPEADDVVCTISGFVENLVWDPFNFLETGGIKDYGTRIIITTGHTSCEAKSFMYCHLKNYLVKMDSFILAGKFIAPKGNSGWSDGGEHLHYEARVSYSDSKSRVDPNDYLPEDMSEDTDKNLRDRSKVCGIKFV